MLSTIATLLSIINGAWTAIKHLFGGGEKSERDETSQAVELSNQSGKLSGEETRATESQVNQELQHNDAQTAVDSTSVRDAGSLQDGSAEVNRAIAGTRPHPDSDGEL